MAVRFYAFGFLWDLVLVYAVDKLLFLSKGLSLTEIAVLMSVWAAMNLAFEIPSGLLADRWDRKRLLVVSAAARALLCLAWLFADTFGGFLIGFVFLAIAQSFFSGTAQAYLHDVLAAHGRTEEFERYWGRLESSRMAGLAAAWAIGGVIGSISFQHTIVLSLVSGIACLLFAVALPSVPRLAEAADENPFVHLKAAFSFAWRNPVILRVFVFAAIVRSTYVVIDEYWPVYFDRLGVPSEQFGLFVGLSTISGALAGIVAYRLKRRPWRTVRIGVLLFAATLVSASFSRSWPAMILMLSLELVTGVLYVLTEGQIQRNVRTGERATVASIASLLKEFGIVTGIAFGWVAGRFGLPVGYAFFAVLLLGYFPADWIARRVRSESAVP